MKQSDIKNQSVPSDLSNAEQSSNVSEDTKTIEKEYQRKMLVVKHKERVARYIKIISWSVLGILLVIALVIIVLKVADIFTQEEEIDTSVVVEDNLPPQDFSIEVEKIVLLQPKKGEASYDILLRLKNNDPEWGASRLRYKVVLLDRFDRMVGEKERISYILPKQEKNFIEISVRTTGLAEKSRVEVDPQEIQKLKQDMNLDIRVEKSSYFERNNKGIVEGTLFNESPFTFDRVDIGAILYDKAGNVIGLNYTNFGQFITKTRRPFSVQWPEAIMADVDKIFIEPSVNIYQSSSFINIYGTGQILEY